MTRCAPSSRSIGLDYLRNCRGENSTNSALQKEPVAMPPLFPTERRYVHAHALLGVDPTLAVPPAGEWQRIKPEAILNADAKIGFSRSGMYRFPARRSFEHHAVSYPRPIDWTCNPPKRQVQTQYDLGLTSAREERNPRLRSHRVRTCKEEAGNNDPDGRDAC